MSPLKLKEKNLHLMVSRMSNNMSIIRISALEGIQQAISIIAIIISVIIIP